MTIKPLIFETVRISVDEIKSVVVSNIEADPTTGGYARLITTYTDTGSDKRPRFELRLTSMDRETLEITTPPQEY